MGADLCGYIIVGPVELSDKKIKEAKNLLTLLKQKATAALAKPINKEAMLYFLLLMGKSRVEADAAVKRYIELRTKFDEDEEGEQAEWLSKCDPEQFINEFVSAWGEDLWRDWMSRLMPGDDKRKILAAGERTWGDGPEEPSMWFSCQKLYQLGLFGVLGLE